jgi:DnaK suppressor protein
MADVVDEANDLAEHHQAAALKHLHEEQERLRRIEASIAPAKPGDERDCRDCGEEIAPERLAILSRASRCTACAEIFERKFRRFP